MEADARLSRFSRQPRLGADDKPIIVKRPSPADFEKFKVMARHRFLTCEWIAACTGGSADFTVGRFNTLKRDPNNWVKVAGEVLENQRAYLFMPLFYELDSKAITYLDERGFSIPKRKTVKNFEHQAMTDQIMASFEIGAAEDPSVEIIPWSEIIATEKTPQKTRDATAPSVMPITFRFNGKNHDRKVSADAHPFGLRRKIDGKQSYIFLSGPETDCATEPIETENFTNERTSIQGKLMAYLAIIEQRTFASQFGFPNFFVPFYTTTNRRMESMMRMLSKLTGGKGSKNILFATHPSIYAVERAVPSGKSLTQSYKRVGYPDFYLNQ